MRKLIGLVLVLLMAGLVGLLAYGYLLGSFRAAGPLTAEKTVVIPSGAGVAAIAQTLADEGVIDDPLVFRINVRLAETGRQLKAGEYLFEPAMSAEAVMERLVSGQVIQRRFTVAEGLTTRAALAIVNGVEGLEGTITLDPAEGALLPETYHFQKGDTRDAIVRRMMEARDAVLADLWPDRDDNLPFSTMAEAVVLASIVEKETGVPEERARVASVFVNRLRLGMPLQTDPTVIYGLSEGTGTIGRPLTRADLAKDHDWNTYTRPGLPPSPICNPGKEAIAAVLHPAETKDLYFVADGTGGHAFAETLEQHNKNVRAWRRLGQ